MKNYENRDNFRPREHVIEITLQLGEYKGTYKKSIGGNCFGLSVLTAFGPDDIEVDEKFLENNCNLKIEENDDGDFWYSCTLKNDEGEETEIEDEARSLQDLIVKIEIVDCKIIKK